MSSLAWIDYDETERQRAERILALFNDKATRDELGFAAIRDSIADHLFPGTTTLHTRLRYMLFVPWLYRLLEARDVPADRLAAEARSLEARLIGALKAGGELTGVIGARAGAALRQTPSSIYWTGLGAWGIRAFPGSIDSHLLSLRDPRRLGLAGRDGGDRRGGGSSLAWSELLPPMPQDLLDHATFTLSRDEAQFLVDRLVANLPHALLTQLARQRSDADCGHVWTHPGLAGFAPETRQLVEHAEVFSHVAQGAALVYNLELSKLRQNEEWIEKYRRRIADWRGALDLARVRAWSLDAFWRIVDHAAHKITPAASQFVAEWHALVVANGGDIETPAARRMVETRERRLKLSESRFRSRTALDNWSGESGAGRMDFRWAVARSHLQDLARAE